MRPVIETIIEPFTEFITVFNNTGKPSMELTRRPIFLSVDQRVYPVSQPSIYKLSFNSNIL